jgi:hypothetical protein
MSPPSGFRQRRPPAKLITAASPCGGSAASATLASPPADVPTAIMPCVVTSARRCMAAIEARRSVEVAWNERA